VAAVKALTLWQPWASLVAIGAKAIETRSWATKYRGPLAIHAAKRPIVLGSDPLWYGDYNVAQGGTWLHGPGLDAPMPFGAIVATAQLVDCVPIVEWLADAPGSISDPILVLEERDTLIFYPRGELTEDGEEMDWSAQVPYGDFRPGRWAWLLDDVQPTTERCPACLGTGGILVLDRDTYHGICRTCHGLRRTNPIPAKGHQGLWEWTP
jgi:hypothetical protein